MRKMDLRKHHPLDSAKLIAQMRMDMWNLDRFNNMNRTKMTQAEIEDVKFYVAEATKQAGEYEQNTY